MLDLLDLQCTLDGAVESFTGFLGVADETPHELAAPIENECLGDSIVVGKQQAYEIIVGLAEWVLNAKLLRKSWNLFRVAWSTDIEADNLQSLSFIFLLEPDQVRDTLATGRAPRRIKIQNQNLALVVSED